MLSAVGITTYVCITTYDVCIISTTIVRNQSCIQTNTPHLYIQTDHSPCTTYYPSCTPWYKCMCIIHYTNTLLIMYMLFTLYNVHSDLCSRSLYIWLVIYVITWYADIYEPSLPQCGISVLLSVCKESNLLRTQWYKTSITISYNTSSAYPK